MGRASIWVRNSGNYLVPGVHPQQENFVERSLRDFIHLDAFLRACGFDCNGLKICNRELPVALFELKVLVIQESASSVRKEVFLDIASARDWALADT